MRRVFVIALLLILFTGVLPTSDLPTDGMDSKITSGVPRLGGGGILSSAGGQGDNRQSVAYMTRTFTGQELAILNSYLSPNTHEETLDLSQFQIAGWSLYEAEMDVNSITATAERETMGIVPNNYITIHNDTYDAEPTGLTTDALYQEFYGKTHDGRLESYTFTYVAPYYTTSLGVAYLVVRSDYSDPSTNTTGYITPFSQSLSEQTLLHDCSGDNAIMDASAPYYVVIDGTAMFGVYAGGWRFNRIYWDARSAPGLETGYHLWDYSSWYIFEGLGRMEAELNYTYTPWNKTTSSPLQYGSPTDVSLRANLTALSGLTWTFTDSSNLTEIDFDSNQSVKIDYDLTLSYRRDATSSVVWSVPNSGQSVQWNVTTSLTYPSVSQERFLNVTVPATWTATGLYNASYPGADYGHYASLGGTVTCSGLDNETWTLTLTSHNHLASMDFYRAGTPTAVLTESRMDYDIDINATIQDAGSDPVTTGSTNLTVWYQDTVVWSPGNTSVQDGSSHYLWDISATVTENGLYTVEEFWANGTEAGYRTRELLLFYPTEIGAAQYSLNGYTDDSVDIEVSFNDTFTPQGLDDTMASLAYSFDGGANTPLIHVSGGTWTATVSTTGKLPGFYQIQVFGEGYALENRSLTVDVVLIHDTDSLTILWSNTDSITYVQSTEISVAYERVGGSPITDAWVNLTIGSTTWNLTYDGVSETYTLLFNGTDTPPGLGPHPMTISAWKVGHKPQSDSTEILTISEEGTTLALSWTDGNSISYVGSTTLVANYTMSNGSAVVGATLTVSVDGTDLSLDWDSGTETYRRTFNGNDPFPGLGSASVSVHAELHGYVTRDSTPDTLTISEEIATLSVSWSAGSSITYVQSTVLIVEYQMSDLTPIDQAVVNVTIGSMTWNLTWHPGSQTYRIQFNGSDNPPGIDVHSLTILADRYGFVYRQDSSVTLTISEESTIFSLEWSHGSTITYVEWTTLAVTYQMSDTTPITTATVNVTFGTTTWLLLYNATSERYEITFLGWNTTPGIGDHTLTILADLYGFQERSDTDQTLTIDEEPTSIDVQWTNSNNITYVQSTTLSVAYRMSNSSPVIGATVVATIDGTPFPLVLNEGNGRYEYAFSGSDDPPGLGTFPVSISATKTGYESRSDTTQDLTLRVQTTLVQVSWTGPNSITYIGSATIVVEYRTSDGTPIQGATVTATIGVDPWTLIWQDGSQDYRYTFLGSEDPPGLGTHTITVECALYGYSTNSSGATSLTITEESTSLYIQWSNGNDPSYFASTYLLVDYRMSNLTTIQGATINVTIDGRCWEVNWNASAGLYTLKFNGSDSPPGVGTHMLTIRADRLGFVGQVDTSEELTLPDIPTSLTLSWTDTGTITYIESTTLRANYSMWNGTPITGATVNATIGGVPYVMTWNALEQAYDVTFYGNQDPPGLGVHTVTVLADKYEFVSAADGETLTLIVDPTSLSISWSDLDQNITYHGSTVLSVQYLSSNLQPISGATLNATIGSDVWALVWNASTSAYETAFHGDDPRLGFTTFTVTIRASLFGFVSLTDSTQELTVRVEDTTFEYVWDPDSTITYAGSTVMNIRYLMSNGSPIEGAIVNVTIGMERWDAVWNDTTQSYQVTFYGTDDPPSLGTHTLFVRASKANYQSLLDYSQHLTITNEPTSIDVWWSDGNTITYVEQTTVWINYTASDGTEISGAFIEIKIGVNEWYYPGGGVFYDSGSGLYYKTFYGSDDPPGLGNHGLTIEASRFGFAFASDSSLTLTITGELGQISSEWIGGGTITYVESTILSVNYTMGDGTAISLATVNVTLDGVTLDLFWDPATETYRRVFYGNDDPPGLGTTNLFIQAWRDGFDYQSDSTMSLTITEEPTTVVVSWSNTDNITYFDSTILRVRYLMSNGSEILQAQLNVTIDTIPWILAWNETAGYYQVEFLGSDDPPGLGTHSLLILADKYGYVAASDDTEKLTLREDPTTLVVDWSELSTITYIQHTYLVINYRMSNGSEIQGATVVVTIGSDDWTLGWNSTAGAYTLRFSGMDDPPGLGDFSVRVDASFFSFESRTANTSLLITEDPATVTSSWVSITFDWTETRVLSFNYSDSQGSLIPDATQREVFINGIPYVLSGTNGTYWITLTNSFDLGAHSVAVNISKFGYTFAYADGISFTIVEAETTLILDWSSTSINYLGQIDLEASYYCVPTGGPVPLGAVTANISVDGGAPVPLTQLGNLWVFNLTGIDLDLGTHNVIIRAQAYGYAYKEDTAQLTVDLVTTNPLVVTWEPANLTIEYFDSFVVTLDYTYYGGDVPEPAEVNVTISGQTFALSFVAGLWTATIDGEQIGLGLHTASFLASAYGYVPQSTSTVNLNVTQAANSFIVLWDPIDLHPSYVDTINVSVVYTQDFLPILEATVLLTINGTDVRTLTYDPLDEMWHLSIEASSLGLGVWNMTLTANKTGYADGIKIDMITIQHDTLVVTPSWVSNTTDYITPITLQIQLRASDGTFVTDAAVEVTVNGVLRSATHLSNGLYEVILGPLIDVGLHTVNITYHGFWFNTDHEYLTLDITEASSMMSVAWSNQTIYYTEGASASVYYEMLNGSVIGGSVAVTVNGSTLSVLWMTDHWEFSIVGSDLGLGLFLCTVNTSAYGFASNSSDFIITIIEVPTSVLVHGSPVQVRINESASVFVTFQSEIGGDPIEGATVGVEWLGGFSILDPENGTYQIDFETLGLDLGTYSLNVTLSRYGYENASATVSIVIVIRPLSAIYESSLTQYENETLTIWVQVHDSISGQPVLGANVVAALGGGEFVLAYDDYLERYQVEVWLNSSFSTGSHGISIDISADGYGVRSIDIPLEILEKSTYEIALSIGEDIVAGGDLTAYFTVTEDGSPVSGVSIRVVLVTNSQFGGPQTFIISALTDSNGNSHAVFQIPADALQGAVIAEYLGSISAWAAESQEIEFDVRTPGGNILMMLLSNPIVLAATGGTGVAAVLALRRRRGGDGTTEAEPPSSAEEPPAATPSDARLVRNLIGSKPEGLSRKEISEATGLSSTKVGNIVRDLLASDSDFFEWRDGKQRLIRRRFEE